MVSRFGPALASLVRLREIDPDGTLWRSQAERLLAATVAAREVNSVDFWRDDIAVPAYRGREFDIANLMQYPRFAPGRGGRPVQQLDTTEVSEMPAIGGPDDWHALNTRMRVVLEDPRQLLAGCFTTMPPTCCRRQAAGKDPRAVVVPGLDGVGYPRSIS